MKKRTTRCLALLLAVHLGLARRAHWSPDSLLTDDKLRHQVHNFVESFEGCVNLDSVFGLRQG